MFGAVPSRCAALHQPDNSAELINTWISSAQWACRLIEAHFCPVNFWYTDSDISDVRCAFSSSGAACRDSIISLLMWIQRKTKFNKTTAVLAALRLYTDSVVLGVKFNMPTFSMYNVYIYHRSWAYLQVNIYSSALNKCGWGWWNVNYFAAFGHKVTQNRKTELMIVLHEVRITKVIEIPPEGDMNVCSKRHGHPSSGCWDMSWLVMASWWRQRISKRRESYFQGTMNVCTKYYGNPSDDHWDLLVRTKVVDRHTDVAKLTSEPSKSTTYTGT